MSVRKPFEKIRWHLLVPLALAVLIPVLLVYAGVSTFELLNLEKRHQLQYGFLRTLWWLTHAYYLSLLLALGYVLIHHLLRQLPSLRSVSDNKWSFVEQVLRKQYLYPAIVTLIILETASSMLDRWDLSPQPLDVQLSATPSRQIRIAAIGGSSTAGFPYQKQFAFPAIVGYRMQDNYPDRPVVVENLSEPGATLEQAYQQLTRLSIRPHVLLVYSGHNEFLTRYRLDRNPDTPSWIQPSYLLPLIERRISRIERHGQVIDNLKLTDISRPLFDLPICSKRELRDRYYRFRYHLESIVKWCQSNQVLPVLITPASNEVAFEPCRSFCPDSHSPEVSREIENLFKKIQRELSNSPRRIVLLEEALRLCPEFSLTWFQLGRVYEARAQYQKAQDAYQKALKFDGFPWRMKPDYAKLYQEIADDYRCPLIDASTILRKKSVTGLLDDTLFHDILHPSLYAHLAIADAVMYQLRKDSLLVFAGTSKHKELLKIPENMPDELSMTLQQWARVCDQVAAGCLGVPRWHTEEAPRRKKASRYQHAARKLRNGIELKSIDLAGIGMPTTTDVAER